MHRKSPKLGEKMDELQLKNKMEQALKRGRRVLCVMIGCFVAAFVISLLAITGLIMTSGFSLLTLGIAVAICAAVDLTFYTGIQASRKLGLL